MHFIYVDRMSHQMMAPSINISKQLQGGNNTLMTRIKKKVGKAGLWYVAAWKVFTMFCTFVTQIWERFAEIQAQLQNGHFWQSAHHGDLLFSYYLWYEDTSVSNYTVSIKIRHIRCS